MTDFVAPQRRVAFVPHLVLGISADATIEEARAAYLEAVRRSPPDRDPERFREVHRAMRAYSEPLEVARELLAESQQMPDLAAMIEEAKQRPPRVPAAVLLAFGDMPPEKTP